MIKEAALYLLNKGAEYALEKAQSTGAVPRSNSPWRGKYRFMSGRSATVDIATALKGITYMCIDRRANAVKALQWTVKRRISQTMAQDVHLDHWCVNLFTNPNPENVRSEVFESIEVYRSIKGNSYLWTPLLFEGDTHPHQMWPLPAHMVTILTGGSNGKIIEGYRFTINGYYIDIDPKYMIHFRNLKPSMHALGLVEGYPIVNAAADSIKADSETKEFIMRYMQNDGLSPVIGMTDDEAPADWGATKKSIMEKMPALKIIGMLGGGMKLMPINAGGVTGSGNTQMIAAADPINVRNICGVFNMRPSMITGDNTSYENADANEYDFHINAIDPFATYIGEVFTKHFSQFEEGLVIQHNKFVRNDPKLDLEIKRSLGFIPNEERRALGKPAIPGGDKYMVPRGFVAHENSVAATLTPTPTDTIEPLPTATASLKKSFDIEQKRFEVWKSIDDIREKNEIHIKRGYIGALAMLKEHIVGKVLKTHKPGIQKEGVSFENLFDVEEWSLTFQHEVSPALRLAMIDAARKASEIVSRDWNEIESNYDESMKSGLSRSTSKISGDPLTTMKSEIEQLLKDNYDKPATELADLITQRFDNIYSQSRANLIARTTATFSINESQKIVWRGLGFKRMWLSSRAAKPREEHLLADGQVEDENGMFDVGGELIEQPGDGSAENSCNCGCYTLPQEVVE